MALREKWLPDAEVLEDAAGERGKRFADARRAVVRGFDDLHRQRRRAVAERAVQIERPARAADRAAERRVRDLCDDQRAFPEFEIVEGLAAVGIVEQAAIGPGADEWIAHGVLLVRGGKPPHSRA